MLAGERVERKVSSAINKMVEERKWEHHDAVNRYHFG